MKNIQYLPPGSSHTVAMMFHHEILRSNALNPRTHLGALVRSVCSGPLWSYEPSKIERTQFSSWFRHIQVRHYENPIIGDLYLIHELTHIKELKLNETTSVEWRRNAIEQEVVASVESEMMVYLHYPWLRKLVFQDTEIFMDRYFERIKNHAKTAMVTEPYSQAFLQKCYDFLKEERLFAMVSGGDSEDIPLHTIYSYSLQNNVWCDHWKNHYKIINDMMRDVLSSDDKDAKMKEYRLRYSTTTEDGDSILFLDPTVSFNDYVIHKIKNLHKI